MRFKNELANRSHCRAFTLIELLVVISVIALLVGILLPVLGKARDTGKDVACLSNLRQLTIGMTAYAVDHKEVFPLLAEDGDAIHGERFWFGRIERDTAQDYAFDPWGGIASGYFGDASVGGCPTSVFNDPESDRRHNTADVDYAYSETVGFNSEANPAGDPVPLATYQFREASRTGMLWDSALLITRGDAPRVRQLAIGRPITYISGRSGEPSPSLHGRHGSNTNANVGWVDGHADTFQPYLLDGLTNAELYAQFNLGFLDEDDDATTAELTDTE